MAEQPNTGATRSVGSGKGRTRPGWSTGDLALIGVVLVALLPIVVATARAIHHGWMPLGDNGLMYVRTADVFSRRSPQLGIWSFGSTSAKALYNHPGPLLYYLFAVPTKVFGIQGLALASALVNSAALVGIAVVGRRLGGPLLGVIAVAATATLCWTMGSQLLFDPWTPNSLLVLFLLFLMLTWTTSRGELVALPVTIIVGSVLLETNLSYGLLVLVLGAWAVVGLGVSLRRRRSADADSWPALRRRTRRTAAVACLALVVCLAPVLTEQFTSAGEGNLARIVHGLPTIKDTLGVRKAVRLVAGVTSGPPWWLRPSMVRIYLHLPSLALAVSCLAVLAALLAWGAAIARRRHDHVTTTGAVTVLVAMLATLATVSRSPVYGANLQPYETRFLWPLAAFVSIVVVAMLTRRLVEGRSARPALGVFGVVALAVSLANLPATPASDRTHAPDWAIPVMADLDHQIGALSHRGTLLVHWDQSEQPQYQFFLSGLLAELRHRDVPFVVDEGFLIRSLGEDRRFTGHNADELVRVATGTRAEVTPAGFRRVAIHRGINQADQRELDTLRSNIGAYLARGELRLTATGTTLMERLGKSSGTAQNKPPDPKQLLGPSRGLLNLFTNGLLVLTPRWTARFARYQQLQAVSDQRTVAVFAAPLGGAGVRSMPTASRP